MNIRIGSMYNNYKACWIVRGGSSGEASSGDNCCSAYYCCSDFYGSVCGSPSCCHGSTEGIWDSRNGFGAMRSVRWFVAGTDCNVLSQCPAQTRMISSSLSEENIR